MHSWPSRPKDKEELVTARLNASRGIKTDLEKIFGIKHSDDSHGIFQEISAEGIGEVDELGQQETLERVFEKVEGALLRPVPVIYKTDK